MYFCILKLAQRRESNTVTKSLVCNFTTLEKFVKKKLNWNLSKKSRDIFIFYATSQHFQVGSLQGFPPCGIQSGRVRVRYGASLGGSLCNTSKMYVQWVRLTSHKSETAQKAQTTWQTTSPWCWSRSPLQRRGFDEPMPLEGWAALCMFVPRPPSKWLYRFNELK